MAAKMILDRSWRRGRPRPCSVLRSDSPVENSCQAPQKTQFSISQTKCGKKTLQLQCTDTIGAMKTDKGQFDEVLRRMLDKPPKKTANIRAKKKRSKASQK